MSERVSLGYRLVWNESYFSALLGGPCSSSEENINMPVGHGKLNEGMSSFRSTIQLAFFTLREQVRKQNFLDLLSPRDEKKLWVHM